MLLSRLFCCKLNKCLLLDMWKILIHLFVVDFSIVCWVFSPIFYRWTLESIGSLEPRRSALEEDFEEEEEKEDNDQPVDELEDGAYEKVVFLPFLIKSCFLYVKFMWF